MWRSESASRLCCRQRIRLEGSEQFAGNVDWFNLVKQFWGQLLMSNLSPFAQFLMRPSVVPAKPLPLIHSTTGYHARAIAASDSISATKCEVFQNENLNYFFVGRPAYKARVGKGESHHWQLPVVFVLQYDAVAVPKRVFPFDSGGFAKGRFPEYIKMMKLEDFECSGVPHAQERIIGSFFSGPGDYFQVKPRSPDSFSAAFPLNAFDQEVEAVQLLSFERHDPDIDDRRITIEIQSASDLLLTATHPLAVIAPYNYLEVAAFRDKITNDWGALALGYSMMPLNADNYHSQIYETVSKLYMDLGLL